MSRGAPLTRRATLGGGGALLAACAAQRRARVPHVELVVATWNIRHGAGCDGRVDLDRTAQALAGLGADVVLLQEVDRGCRRSGGVDQAAALGARLGWASAFAAHRPFDGGEYGLALLSRPPVRGSRALPLAAAPRPLAALEAELDLGHGQRLTVVVVHLVDTLEERAAEAREIAARLARVAGPWLVGGDFNGPRGTAPVEALAAGVVALPAEPRGTFPADAPLREIDFLVAGPAGAAAWRGARVAPEVRASDHRPVVARLVLGGDSAAAT